MIQILDECVDVGDIEKRSILHSLLLCNRQIHDEAVDMFIHKTLLVKVDFACSASLYRVMLEEMKHIIPDLVSTEGTNMPTISQEYDIHMTMTDINIKSTRRASFFVVGPRAMNTFLDFLAGRDPNVNPRSTSSPRDMRYNFTFTQRCSRRSRQSLLEKSFFESLTSTWWSFPYVKFEGETLNCLAAAAAQQISQPCKKTMAEIEAEVQRKDGLAKSFIAQKEYRQAAYELERLRSLLERWSITTPGWNPPISMALTDSTNARYNELSSLHHDIITTSSDDTMAHAEAVITNVVKCLRTGAARECHHLRLRWQMVQAYRLLGRWTKAWQLIQKLKDDNDKAKYADKDWVIPREYHLIQAKIRELQRLEQEGQRPTQSAEI